MICPYCHHNGDPAPVSFTWWGGVLGPRLLHHVQCPRCGARFNGHSGRPNTTAISIYLAAAGVIALVVGALLTMRH